MTLILPLLLLLLLVAAAAAAATAATAIANTATTPNQYALYNSTCFCSVSTGGWDSVGFSSSAFVMVTLLTAC